MNQSGGIFRVKLENVKSYKVGLWETFFEGAFGWVGGFKKEKEKIKTSIL